MKISLSQIRSPWLRRPLAVAVLPLLLAIALVLGALDWGLCLLLSFPIAWRGQR